MPAGTVDRIRVTTVVDNYIDNLRQDDAIARRYSAFVAGKMPDLRSRARSGSPGRGHPGRRPVHDGPSTSGSRPTP